MAYRIEYGSEIKKTELKTRLHLRLPVLTAGFFLLFMLFAHIFWQDGLIALRSVLLPEGTAVAAFVESLQGGIPVSEAIDAFCQQVIGNGQ